MHALEQGLIDPTWTAALEQEGEFMDLPAAVIMDIDGTILNNVAFQCALVASGKGSDPALWNAWARSGKATEVPGAKDFILGVRNSNKARVFFITGRSQEVEAATRKNLFDLGIPVSDDPLEILSAKEAGEDKSAQREFVAKSHRIVLIIGDDLNDFMPGAMARPTDRIKLADRHVDRWGKKWILLPNPLDGSWEGSLYDYDYKLSDKEKLEVKYKLLRPFEP